MFKVGYITIFKFLCCFFFICCIQDAVKYLENQVQNVGDSVKKFYSGVVHELLPFNSLASSKYEDHLLLAETNNIDFSVDSVESVACCKDNNKKRDEENPINNYYPALMDSNAIDIAAYKQAGVLVKDIIANQESDESCSVSLELEDSCITQEEVGSDSRGTSESKKENFHARFEEIAVESVPKLMDLMSVGDKESLEFPIHRESSSDNFGSGCEVSIRTKVNIDVNPGKNSCLIADENVMKSSSSHVLSSQSLDEEIAINYSCLALHDSNAVDTADIQKGGVHSGHVLKSQVSDESCSVSLEVEDSYITQEVVGEDSIGTSGTAKENIHTSIEEVVVESVPEQMNLMSVGEKESLEFSIHKECCSDSFDSGHEVSLRTKDKIDVNPGHNTCLIVEENAMNSSSSQMLSSQSLDEEIAVNYFCLALHDYNAIDIVDVQKVGLNTRNANEFSDESCDESCSVSLDEVDSYISQEEFDDDSRRTSVSTKETIHTSIKEVALESVPKPLNMMSGGDKESLEFPIHSGYKVSIRTKDNRDVNPFQISCLIVEENAMNSSMSQVLSSQSLDEEEESINVSLFSESSNADQNTHGILAEVSPDVSVSSERPMTRTEPSCSSSSLTLGSLYSKPLGRYSFENESCKSNPGCESSTNPAGPVMEPQGCLVFSGYFQSMESEGWYLQISIYEKFSFICCIFHDQ